jgi:hypothetical protein
MLGVLEEVVVERVVPWRVRMRLLMVVVRMGRGRGIKGRNRF